MRDAIGECRSLSPQIALNVALAGGRIGSNPWLLMQLRNRICTYIMQRPGITSHDKHQWYELQCLVSRERVAKQ
eukprot:NODE_7208_length_455_cov_1.005000.p3 GENE.NODE_7208_length_455_cov_1.005000~~NODE_7208_length_455_cov_1.005000.p3  ORF type:complete len:74 (-),score=13.84 NODE_7208_length_455_cov_1.005000:88-309(-)